MFVSGGVFSAGNEDSISEWIVRVKGVWACRVHLLFKKLKEIVLRMISRLAQYMF